MKPDKFIYNKRIILPIPVHGNSPLWVVTSIFKDLGIKMGVFSLTYKEEIFHLEFSLENKELCSKSLTFLRTLKDMIAELVYTVEFQLQNEEIQDD